MNFLELVNEVNKFDVNSKEQIKSIVDNIDITDDNFNEWSENICSQKVDLFDMSKLPYLIDELYMTDDKLKFMICCMLLEVTCDRLEFITNLESYPMFVEKFKFLTNTLVSVYEYVNNGIANCMSLIIINNDPEFTFFDDELKKRLIEATKIKLKAILNYLKTPDFDKLVYEDLEIIIDLACYLKDDEISKLVNEIDMLGNNGNADIFVIKYKVINNMEISKEKLNILKQDYERLELLYNIMEQLNVNDIYLKDVSQESIARSNMIKWLEYPTELGTSPDKIELLGQFIYNNTRCFAYKFSKEGFKMSGELLGVSGGYPMDKISSNSCGYTFSKFEVLSNDWESQSRELVDFISNYWKERSNSIN